jgi:hypothetical protein
MITSLVAKFQNDISNKTVVLAKRVLNILFLKVQPVSKQN